MFTLSIAPSTTLHHKQRLTVETSRAWEHEPIANLVMPGPAIAPGITRKQAMKLDRITCDASRLNGQPCIRDLRLTVRRVLEAMAIYPDREDLRREYPELEDEDLRQALEYATSSQI
jgi:uncharacterized protein (DUF433 family)